MKKRNLIPLFDIDGTLLKVKNTFMKELILTVFSDLEIPPPDLSTESFAGRTDFDIFNALLRHTGREEEIFPRVKQGYISVLDSNLSTEHVQVIAGVEECLSFCSSLSEPIGLLTGNFETSGFKKLKCARLDSYFSFGGFGEVHKSRNDLPPVAFEAYGRLTGKKYSPSDFCVIGDTPSDILCAKANGAISVAVCTGWYSKEELAGYKPDVLIDTMENPAEWLGKLQYY